MNGTSREPRNVRGFFSRAGYPENETGNVGDYLNVVPAGSMNNLDRFDLRRRVDNRDGNRFTTSLSHTLVRPPLIAVVIGIR